MENIKRARGMNLMSQDDLSEKTGIPKWQIGRYERGEQEPKASTLGILADALGVTVDYLLGREAR